MWPADLRTKALEARLGARTANRMGNMTEQEQAVRDHLRELGIAFERYEHPPIATAAEGEKHWTGIQATHSKNLFLRNQKGDRHYLLVVVHSKRVDLRARR